MSFGAKFASLGLALGLAILPVAAAAQALMDLVTHNSIDIVAPPAKIWPHVLTLEWKVGPKLVSIAGDPTNVGGRFKGVEKGDVAEYYVENVEMVTNQIRTIRLNALDGTLLGYASFSLAPQGRSTRVRYDVYSLLPSPSRQAAADLKKACQERFDRELSALKRIVETPRKRR